MKLSQVVIASSIAVVTASSGLRASSAEGERQLQTADMAAACGVTEEDLDFKSCNPQGCCENVLIHLKETMEEKDCNIRRKSVIQELKLYTEERNTRDAKEALKEECESSLEESDDDEDESEDDEDEDDEPTNACTSMDGMRLNGCDFQSIYKAVEENMSDDCTHGMEDELKLLTGAASYDNSIVEINNLCSSAWDNVTTSNFVSIDDTFTDDFMQDYIRGDTFLNLKTGNFQGRGTRNSDRESVEAGEAIDNFYEADENGAANTVMKANFPSDVTNFEDCSLNSIMCCFGRDRQFGDNNGNCNRRDCDDADPADNSNLCFTESSNTPFPEENEGDVHCHGLAWADDENDFTAKFKYNNFFYVSLYDHMYQRGYVQEMTFDRPDITDTVPMCGCMEDMHPVSRSDCTEVAVEQTFQFSIGTDGKLQAEPRGEMQIDFNSCKGINPRRPWKRANNDLASYVYRLEKEGKISNATKNSIYEKLVGYARPGQNDNENACANAYEKETGDEYPSN